ncbi:type VII secretion protein EccB [Corynebacterium sp. HMSC074A01]|uniref:type VII secretion protein EccB n=1 Tax=Corynebacterium sp. HMSC074A01 TaxID=1715030 RepID=UPI0008A1DA54|nr:type VII secretion protein EccB [Corynebacterium sp. HMSC074A01]OHF37123.1 type VII secretion protein EccB [Corynebacterium sp. HMSC074A01]
MARLLPTTKTQVSGHRFLRRRVEHGLILGDIRMIHDPLSSRRRAMIFGVVAVVMISGVMGLFAWMRPNPNPGEAAIIRATDGSLFARVDDTVHPVTNLTSARLIVGAPEEPVRAGDEHLAKLARGVPVGIGVAPSVFAPEDAADTYWSACTVPGERDAEPEVVVRAVDAQVPSLGLESAIVAEVDHRDWLVTAQGRTQLPPSTTPDGRIVRRVLGIDASTPRWRPPAQLFGALQEQPSFALPDPLPRVLRTGEREWAETSGGVQPITSVQTEILLEAGAQVTEVPAQAVAEKPDAENPAPIRLPEHDLRLLDPAGEPADEPEATCITEDGGAATLPASEAMAGHVRLSGAGAASYFVGLPSGAVAVDTGNGYHVVDQTGLRHGVPDEATLEAIGAAKVEQVPWRLVQLLPRGEALERTAALTATY